MEIREIPIQWTPEMSIYASEKFLRSVSDAYGWVGGYEASGPLRCVLPYTIIKKPFVKIGRFRVETHFQGAPLTIEEEKDFLNGVVKLLRKKGVDLIIPASTNTIFRTHPDGAQATSYGTYINDLTQTEEALFGKLNSSHRRKVRLAIKGNVVIKTGNEFLESAYNLVKDTFARSSLDFMGLESFRRMIEGLGQNVRIMVADYEGKIHGAIVVPFSLHTAYYVYGGSIPEPAQGAMNLLHWEAMRHFRALGVKNYDFVGVRINPTKGSKQEGLLMFKERFGGELRQGFLWKLGFSPLKYFAYNMAVKYKRGGDIVDQETNRKPEPTEEPAPNQTMALEDAGKSEPSGKPGNSKAPAPEPVGQ